MGLLKQNMKHMQAFFQVCIFSTQFCLWKGQVMHHCCNFLNHPDMYRIFQWDSYSGTWYSWKLCEDLESLLKLNVLNAPIPVFHTGKMGRAVNPLQYNLNAIILFRFQMFLQRIKKSFLSRSYDNVAYFLTLFLIH